MASSGPALPGRVALSEPDRFHLEHDPRALRVCKKPVPVHVEFAAADGICRTLEGEVRFRAGDALLTGGQGEHWPVRRDLFLSSYEPVPPTRSGANGTYRKLPAVARARRLTAAAEVSVSWQNDPLHGQAGDWLIRYADGSYGIVRDSIFRETYAPADDEKRWPPP
jgi:hypothetical protein